MAFLQVGVSKKESEETLDAALSQKGRVRERNDGAGIVIPFCVRYSHPRSSVDVPQRATSEAGLRWVSMTAARRSGWRASRMPRAVWMKTRVTTLSTRTSSRSREVHNKTAAAKLGDGGWKPFG